MGPQHQYLLKARYNCSYFEKSDINSENCFELSVYLLDIDQGLYFSMFFIIKNYIFKTLIIFQSIVKEKCYDQSQENR